MRNYLRQVLFLFLMAALFVDGLAQETEAIYWGEARDKDPTNVFSCQGWHHDVVENLERLERGDVFKIKLVFPNKLRAHEFKIEKVPSEFSHAFHPYRHVLGSDSLTTRLHRHVHMNELQPCPASENPLM